MRNDAVAMCSSSTAFRMTHRAHRPQGRVHAPVMIGPVLQWLNPQPGQVMVDATVGAGGHAIAILPRLMPDGRLIGVDRDPEALDRSRTRLNEFAPQAPLVHGSFRHLPELLQGQGAARIDGLLLDLGISSLQLEDAERGFSFSHEGPLDMRMDRAHPTSAATLVNTLPADELATLISEYGEERYARRIATRIVQARAQGPIDTTTQLARLVVSAMPPRARHGRLHAATRTFQALRIAVNQELDALTEGLEHLSGLLNPGGRVVILSFHSLEDRIVKQVFARAAKAGWGRLLTKKPVRATQEEVAQNPRARSAKLRALEAC